MDFGFLHVPSMTKLTSFSGDMEILNYKSADLLTVLEDCMKILVPSPSTSVIPHEASDQNDTQQIDSVKTLLAQMSCTENLSKKSMSRMENRLTTLLKKRPLTSKEIFNALQKTVFAIISCICFCVLPFVISSCSPYNQECWSTPRYTMNVLTSVTPGCINGSMILMVFFQEMLLLPH